MERNVEGECTEQHPHVTHGRIHRENVSILFRGGIYDNAFANWRGSASAAITHPKANTSEKAEAVAQGLSWLGASGPELGLVSHEPAREFISQIAGQIDPAIRSGIDS